MSKECKVTKYYGQFCKLAESLLNVHLLDDKDWDALFWHDFCLDDCALLLYYFSKHPHQPPGVYYYLQEVYNAACYIFS